MINAAAALFFLAFAGLSLLVMVRGRAVAHLLITYVVVLTVGVGLVQLDFWPFSAWPLIALYHPPDASHVRLAVVDSAGVEHPIDARALGTMSYPEVAGWVDGPFRSLDDRQRAATFSWILQRVEQSRQVRIRDGRFPRAAAPLGPLTAPWFLIMPRFWDGDGVPMRPLVALRLYRDRWNLEERAANPSAVRRELLYEYREGAGR
jgi:hypothetical protein